MSSQSQRSAGRCGSGSGIDDSGWVHFGLGFAAIMDSTLASFTFQNQGLGDTVLLVYPAGDILDQVATAAGIFSNTVSVRGV